MNFEWQVWYADQPSSSGGKFYQVIRLVDKARNSSLHIENYGKKSVFVKLGTAPTGTVKVVAPTFMPGTIWGGNGTDSGKTKIEEKSKGGYSNNVQRDTKQFADIGNLRTHIRKSLTSADAKVVLDELTRWVNSSSTPSPSPNNPPQQPAAPQVPTPRAPDPVQESTLHLSPGYGTW